MGSRKAAVTQHRIAIIGPAASGKTTLATRMAERLRIPAFHLDDYLLTGRRYVSDDEQRRRVPALVAGSEWVIEGGYWRTADLLFASATIIVVLDTPLHRGLSRFLRRERLNRRVQSRWRTARDVFSLWYPLFWMCVYPLVERRRVLRAARDRSVHGRVIVAKTSAQAEREIRLATTGLPEATPCA